MEKDNLSESFPSNVFSEVAWSGRKKAPSIFSIQSQLARKKVTNTGKHSKAQLKRTRKTPSAGNKARVGPQRPLPGADDVTAGRANALES